ncbi:MAG: PD40 domain-containing protein, partial [Flavobacteriales bacterium]|nr:PD40 domain-containing protein [Flavobacteriales bacterium]
LLASLRVAIASNTLTPTQSTDLGEQVANLYLDHFKPIYFLFDQFEELFIFGRQEESVAFFEALHKLLEKERNAHVIFIVREEYLAELTRYERIIPGLIENRYRVERMARGRAVEVVEKLCAANGISCSPGFSEAMIDRLNPEGQGVELSYLQVYLDKLHRMARERQGNGALQFETGMLNEAGSITDLLGGFLEEQVATMPDPANAFALLKAFVSSRGTKRQNTVEEARMHARTLGRELVPEEVRAIVLRFVDLRILREKDDHERYELLHDALAAKIYESITLVEKELLEVRQFVENAYVNFERRGHSLTSADLAYLAPYEDKLFLSGELAAFVERCRADERSARQLKRKVNIVSLLGLLLLVSATAYFFYTRSTTSRANELGALALIAATEDPTYSYLLAEEADAVERTTITEKALINAFHNGPFASEFDGLKPTVSPDGRYIATIGPAAYGSYRFDRRGIYPDQDSTVTIRDLDGRIMAVLMDHHGLVADLGFFPDGRHLFTLSTDSVLRFWDVEGRLLRAVKVESVPTVGTCRVVDGRLRYKHHSYMTDTEIWRMYSEDGDLVWERSAKAQLPENSVSFHALRSGHMLIAFERHVEIQALDGEVLHRIPSAPLDWSSCYVNPGRTSFVLFDHKTRTFTTWSEDGVQLHRVVVSGIPIGAPFARVFPSTAFYRVLSYLDRGVDHYGMVVVDTLGNTISTLPVSPPHLPEGTFFNWIEQAEMTYADRIWDEGLLLNLRKESFKAGQVLSDATAMGVEWAAAFELSRGQPNAVQFDPRSGKLVFTFSGPTIVSMNGEFSATLTEGHEVQVARLDTRLREYIFRSTETLIMRHLMNNGSLLLSNGRKRVILVRNPTGEKRLPFNADAVETYSIADRSGHVATILDGGKVAIWTGSGDRMGTIDTKCDTAAYWVKFAPDSAHVLVLKGNEQLGLYAISGAPVASFRPHVDMRNCENVAAFSADGRSFAYGAMDGTVRIVDMSGQERAVLRGHGGAVLAVAWPEKLGRVVSASADSTLIIWEEGAKGYAVEHIIQRQGEVTSVEPVMGKPYVLAACADSSWFIADLRGRVIRDARDLVGTRARKPITYARFSPNRDFMMTEFRIVTYDTVLREDMDSGDFNLVVNRNVSRSLTQLIDPEMNVRVDQEEDYGYIGINALNKQNVSGEDLVDGDIHFSHGLTRLITLKGRRPRFSPDGRYLYYIDEAERLRRIVADPDHVIRLVREQKAFGPIRDLRAAEREDLGL